MELRKNLVAAIASAVGLYMQEEQEALMAMQARKAPQPGQAYSPWVMSGRSAAMDMRRAWQLRLVR